MNEKLLPCPYCKAEPFFIDRRFTQNGKCEYFYTVRCSKCGKASFSSNFKAGLGANWNRLVEYLTKEMESEVEE